MWPIRLVLISLGAHPEEPVANVASPSPVQVLYRWPAVSRFPPVEACTPERCIPLVLTVFVSIGLLTKVRITYAQCNAKQGRQFRCSENCFYTYRSIDNRVEAEYSHSKVAWVRNDILKCAGISGCRPRDWRNADNAVTGDRSRSRKTERAAGHPPLRRFQNLRIRMQQVCPD